MQSAETIFMMIHRFHSPKDTSSKLSSSINMASNIYEKYKEPPGETHTHNHEWEVVHHFKQLIGHRIFQKESIFTINLTQQAAESILTAAENTDSDHSVKLD